MQIREKSAAYLTLRPSVRRLLMFVDREIARAGRAGPVTVYNDQLEMIGSRRIWLSGLEELHALGLLDVERKQKLHICAPSDRWRKPEVWDKVTDKLNARVKL